MQSFHLFTTLNSLHFGLKRSTSQYLYKRKKSQQIEKLLNRIKTFIQLCWTLSRKKSQKKDRNMNTRYKNKKNNQNLKLPWEVHDFDSSKFI